MDNIQSYGMYMCENKPKNLASHDEFRIRIKNKKHKKKTTTHSKNQESVNLNHSFIHSLGPNEQKHTHIQILDPKDSTQKRKDLCIIF